MASLAIYIVRALGARKWHSHLEDFKLKKEIFIYFNILHFYFGTKYLPTLQICELYLLEIWGI